MKIINLGWGVQSFALAAMSALEILPRVDAAVHADTTWERSETYDFAKRWTPWLEGKGIRVI
jgi:3'-phosphoadenosine 5'-phosphosulfate sulfotransferase (PAPS reductase)/FAD synthetase